MTQTPRTAVVTGAGKRVGAVIARALLRDGWTVLAHVHHTDDDVPPGAIQVCADLAKDDCADRIFDSLKDLPPLGLLINNAARFARDEVGALKVEEFDQHMAINVRAPALLSDAFARHFAGDDGLIVNILDAKLAAPNPDFLSYTLSKHSLAGLTDLSARALAGQGIRVNAIAPALMLRSSGQTEANFAAMHSANPLRRGVEPEDVAEAVRYLIGARCVTGQVLTLDSGQRFLNLPRDVQFLS